MNTRVPLLAVWNLPRSLLASGLLFLLTACNLPADSSLELASEQARSTRAAATVNVLMTSARASLSPSPPQQTQPATSTDGGAGETAQSSDDCLAQAAFVDDVTIRDGTILQPGESFVKVWRLLNSGNCTWSPEYTLVFFGGSRLGAPESVPLSARVNPQQTVDIALEMSAPNDPGTYQGYWKLQTPSGRYFGIGPSSDESFWVKIEVTAPAIATTSPGPSLTPTASTTPTAPATADGSGTATATPYAQGSATLAIDQAFDLDAGEIVTSNEADIRLYQETANSVSIQPLQSSQIAQYSPAQAQPDQADCASMQLSSLSIPLSGLASGDHICYQTATGRLGFLRIEDLTPVLRFFFLTFSP